MRTFQCSIAGWNQSWFTVLFLVLLLLTVGLAIAGAVLHYSPIPFWDVWTGYVDFIAQINNGDYSRWWAGHNEHRIVLSRMLFWLDANVFGGDFKFLIVVNYLLLASIALTFCVIARQLCPSIPLWLQCFFGIWLFSWIQHENLTWGFQSQFFLAQLLPLLSFYTLHLSTTRGKRYFYLALALGVMSLGTMANGVLALPLMVFFAVFAHLPRYQIISLAFATIIGIGAYFYQLPSHGGSASQALREQPFELIQYVLLYLGAPFYTFFDKGEVARWLASLISAAMVLSCAVIFGKNWRNFRQQTLTLALLTFILYLGGSALATALGRAMLGLEQAASSRYLTPTLMLWVAFFLLLWLQPKTHNWFTYSGVKGGFIIFALVIVVAQSEALKTNTLYEKNKHLAVLAMTLGADDPSVIHRIHWNSAEALKLIQPAKNQRVAIFSHPPFRDILSHLGQEMTLPKTTTCQGYVEQVSGLDTQFLKLSGWAAVGNHTAQAIGYILDEDHKLSGAVFVGEQRHDVAKTVGKQAEYAGFSGYASQAVSDKTVTIYFPVGACTLQYRVSSPLFQYLSLDKKDLESLVKRVQISQTNDWLGSDYDNSQLNGMMVFGSYITGDTDTGSIKLKLQRGDQLMYRTGPVHRRQTLRIDDNATKHALLPATSWHVLDFNSPNLPDSFTVTLTDEGNGWGEWSAIAVSNE